MSTRSHIVVRHEDNNYEYRYIHWDGYIRGVGKVLSEIFSDSKDVKKIFKIESDFSSVLNRKGDKSTDDEMAYIKKQGGDHSFNEINGYYLIDKGNVSSGLKGNLIGLELEEINNRCAEDYTYLYDMKSKNWFVRHWDSPYEDLKLQLFIAKLHDLVESDIIEDIKVTKVYNKIKNLSSKKLSKVMENIAKPEYSRILGGNSDGISPKLFSMVEKALMDKEALKSDNMKNNGRNPKVSLKV